MRARGSGPEEGIRIIGRSMGARRRAERCRRSSSPGGWGDSRLCGATADGPRPRLVRSCEYPARARIPGNTRRLPLSNSSVRVAYPPDADRDWHEPVLGPPVHQLLRVPRDPLAAQRDRSQDSIDLRPSRARPLLKLGQDTDPPGSDAVDPRGDTVSYRRAVVKPGGESV